MDRIKRKLIEEFEGWQESLSPRSELRDRVILDTLELVIETIANFDEDKIWIPCSEQEPYEKGDQIKSILVTMEDYKGDRWTTHTLNKSSLRDNSVVAWRPEFKPYMGDK